MSYTRVEVEANAGCPMSAYQVYKNLGEPFPIRAVRVYEGDPAGRLCAVAGWSSEAGGSPVQAWAVQVEDSGAGGAYLVYGADWGLRLRPAESAEAWDPADPAQWGETHLVLADAADLVV
jgi:hypothetical protein